MEPPKFDNDLTGWTVPSLLLEDRSTLEQLCRDRQIQFRHASDMEFLAGKLVEWKTIHGLSSR